MNRRQPLWVILGLWLGLAVLMSACTPTLGPAVDESPLGTPGTAEPGPTAGEATPSPTEQTGEVDVRPQAAPIVQQAKEDLAARLAISIDEIELVSLEQVEWPDASLGCPQPGMSYAEVITPGFKLIFSARGRQYEYHTGGDNVVLCEDAGMGLEPGPIFTPTLDAQIPSGAAPLVRQAIEALSAQTGIAPVEIVVTSVEAVQWRDSSLGCPQPGMSYLTVITPGYLIRLEAGGQAYEYHASQNAVVTCEDPEPPFSPDS